DYKSRESGKTDTPGAGATPLAPATGLMGHTEEVTRVAFTPDGKRVISSSRDKTTRIWGLAQRTASLHQTVDGLMTARARFSPDGLLIAAAAMGNVRLRDSVTGRLVRELPAPADQALNVHSRFLGSVAFTPDNRWLAVGFGGQSDVSHVELWDIDRGDRVAVLPGTTDIPNFSTNPVNGIVSAICFSPDGKVLAAGFGSLSS